MGAPPIRGAVGLRRPGRSPADHVRIRRAALGSDGLAAAHIACPYLPAPRPRRRLLSVHCLPRPRCCRPSKSPRHRRISSSRSRRLSFSASAGGNLQVQKRNLSAHIKYFQVKISTQNHICEPATNVQKYWRKGALCYHDLRDGRRRRMKDERDAVNMAKYVIQRGMRRHEIRRYVTGRQSYYGKRSCSGSVAFFYR